MWQVQWFIAHLRKEGGVNWCWEVINTTRYERSLNSLLLFLPLLIQLSLYVPFKSQRKPSSIPDPKFSSKSTRISNELWALPSYMNSIESHSFIDPALSQNITNHISNLRKWGDLNSRIGWVADPKVRITRHQESYSLSSGWVGVI